VATVELTTAGPRIDLYPISAALVTNGSAPLPRLATAASEADGKRVSKLDGERVSRLKVGILDPSLIYPEGSAGLVVVTPRSIKRTALASATDVLRVTGWPAVGAIVYPGRGTPQRAVRQLAAAAATIGRMILASIKALADRSYRAATTSAREAHPVSEAGQSSERR
jgi:hypothetical protein